MSDRNRSEAHRAPVPTAYPGTRDANGVPVDLDAWAAWADALSHEHRKRLAAAGDPLARNQLRVRELEEAIGVMVPTILRAYIETTEYPPERKWTWEALKRINDAMRRPTDSLESMPCRAAPSPCDHPEMLRVEYQSITTGGYFGCAMWCTSCGALSRDEESKFDGKQSQRVWRVPGRAAAKPGGGA